MQIAAGQFSRTATVAARCLSSAASQVLGKTGAASIEIETVSSALLRGDKVAPPTVPIQIRNRPFLPASWDQSLPETLAPAREEFPLVMQPADESLSIHEFADSIREELQEHLLKYGAVLLRKTPLKTSMDFNEFMSAISWRTQNYADYLKFMGARSMTSTQVSASVRTASDEPSEYTIEPHCEYHTVNFPEKILLFCESPPTIGGEWPCTDNRAVYNALKSEVREKFERLGVEYEVFYESKENAKYNSWQQNIAEEKQQVEEYLSALGYTWTWDETGALRYYQTFPAVKPHPKTQEPCWFNQLHAHHYTFYQAHPFYSKEHPECRIDVQDPKTFDRWPVRSRYGDGTDIEEEVLSHVRQTVWENTVAVPMQPGDLLICDNFFAKHGRMGYPSTEQRKVAVSVTYE